LAISIQVDNYDVSMWNLSVFRYKILQQYS